MSHLDEVQRLRVQLDELSSMHDRAHARLHAMIAELKAHHGELRSMSPHAALVLRKVLERDELRSSAILRNHSVGL